MLRILNHTTLNNIDYVKKRPQTYFSKKKLFQIKQVCSVLYSLLKRIANPNLSPKINQQGKG